MAAFASFVAPAFGKVASDIPKARAPSRDLEHKEQCAVIQWWALAHKQYSLPDYALFSIPNGGSRHMLTAVRMKAEGLRSGIPDLMLAVKMYFSDTDKFYCGAFIEMKAGNGVESERQKAVREYMTEAGYKSVVCYGAKPAIDFIQRYLANRWLQTMTLRGAKEGR